MDIFQRLKEYLGKEEKISFNSSRLNISPNGKFFTDNTDDLYYILKHDINSSLWIYIEGEIKTEKQDVFYAIQAFLEPEDCLIKYFKDIDIKISDADFKFILTGVR